MGCPAADVLGPAVVVLVYRAVHHGDDGVRLTSDEALGLEGGRQARPVPDLALCEPDRIPVDLLLPDPRVSVPLGGRIPVGRRAAGARSAICRAGLAGVRAGLRLAAVFLH